MHYSILNLHDYPNDSTYNILIKTSSANNITCFWKDVKKIIIKWTYFYRFIIIQFIAEDVFLITVLKDYQIEQNGHEKGRAAPINPYHMHINIKPLNKNLFFKLHGKWQTD